MAITEFLHAFKLFSLDVWGDPPTYNRLIKISLIQHRV
jgi:hypothetical protein